MGGGRGTHNDQLRGNCVIPPEDERIEFFSNGPDPEGGCVQSRHCNTGRMAGNGRPTDGDAKCPRHDVVIAPFTSYISAIVDLPSILRLFLVPQLCVVTPEHTSSCSHTSSKYCAHYASQDAFQLPL